MMVPLGIAFAVVVMAVVFVLLLRRQLREKYAILWLVIGLAILVLGVFPHLLVALARFLDVLVPSNLLFALTIVLLIGVALHLSWELSTAEEQIRRVAEEAAIARTDQETLITRVAALEALNARTPGRRVPPDGPTDDGRGGSGPAHE